MKSENIPLHSSSLNHKQDCSNSRVNTWLLPTKHIFLSIVAYSSCPSYVSYVSLGNKTKTANCFTIKLFERISLK